MDKPPSRIPPMAEINAVEPNGFTVASTFAGCGGSSLGYRWAGFRVGYASEFIPAAADTYEANKREWTHLDRRDIRQVSARDVLGALGMMPRQLDVLDGSPPCASFSMAGKRSALWGAVKTYSDTTQRVDDLFGEYLRLVKTMQPKVAVAENVPGLTIGVARGFYNEIMQGFEDAGYVAEAAILEAEWLGVPQARHRLFFVAVRRDLAEAGLKPVFPRPLTYYYSIANACPWILKAIVGNKAFEPRWGNTDVPSPTIMTTLGRTSGACEARIIQQHGMGGSINDGAEEDGLKRYQKEIDQERPLPMLCGTQPAQFLIEPETDISNKAIGREWDEIGGIGQSEKFFQLVRPEPDKPCPTVTATAGNLGAASVVHPIERRKFAVAELKRLCGFPDDFILTGTYSQQVERLGRAVMPPVTAALGCTIAEKILRPWAEHVARKQAA